MASPSCLGATGVRLLYTGTVDSTPPATSASPEAAIPTTVPAPVALHVLTANIQSIKDQRCCVFNPSGMGARRQYLHRQLQQMQADIVCVCKRPELLPADGALAAGSLGDRGLESLSLPRMR